MLSPFVSTCNEYTIDLGEKLNVQKKMLLMFDHTNITASQRIKFTEDLGNRLDVAKKTPLKIHNVNFIDVQTILCETPSTNYGICKPFDKKGMPKSYDGGHLTKFGATYYGLGLKDELMCIIFDECGRKYH